MRVFLQMCMDCLEKRCVLMIGGCLFDYLLVMLEFLGVLFVGTDVGVVDLQFWKDLNSIYLFTKKFCIYCNIL